MFLKIKNNEKTRINKNGVPSETPFLFPLKIVHALTNHLLV